MSARSRRVAVAATLLAVGLAATAAQSAVAAGTVTGPASAVTPDAASATAIPGFVISGSTLGTITAQVTSGTGTLTLTTTTGVTVDPASTSTSLLLSGSEANVNAALAGLEYTRVGTAADTVTVEVPNDDQFVCAATGHVYQLVNSAVNWDAARTASAAMFGGNGYLVTVTSAAENDCVFDSIGALGQPAAGTWIGAEMSASLQWAWATGPEAGTAFWSGGRPSNGGVPLGGEYSFWDTAYEQPDGDLNQRCAQYYSDSGVDATWHDNGCGVLNKYVAEVDAAFVTLPSAQLDVLALPAPPAPPVPGGGGSGGAELAATGSDAPVVPAIAALVAIAGGALLLRRDRRRTV